ncbi:N-alpha-acetyltransferase 35, NatC auxiliary subunit-like isoform X3 [Ostrea edulis]|uniref:N-alpha-acetyltransferase 35, NatC auxiliary subunit-like isoform X3 n=1 Tax=Ostrea edulis TaxID=37623 RepID=UPI0024AEB436|nr:N-alpha-acetyltransferase 35, NatC auxiliary subunit-like isoform X3 [Ostrea edulis]
MEGDVKTQPASVPCVKGNDMKNDNKPRYDWADVTEEFMTSASELQMGELLHDTGFGLFEAMSAIEMMDPKMDAGMMCNQIQRKVLTFDLALEATWLEGHSLAQTVFTNLYLHNPYVVEDRCLKAFSILMLKLVDHIRDKVNRAGVFEEEDFQSMTYGFKMAADVTDVRATGMMKEVEDDLNRILKMTRSKVGEERDEQTEQEHERTNALFSRVKFIRLFFTTLLSFSKEKCEGIPQAQKLIGQLLELLPTIRDTICMGIQPDNKQVGKNDYPTIMGFEPLVNQRLLPPTFPRYTVIRSRDDALIHIEGLLYRLQIVTTVPELTTFHIIMEAFQEFSKSSPCVLSRSILQLTLLPLNKRVFGVHTMVDFLKDTIRNFIAPPVLSQKSALYNNSQAKQYVDAWFVQVVRPFTSLVQITGHNRARQRDKWAHILEDLSALQEEADKVDACLHQILTKLEPNRQHIACLGNWVLYHTLQAMINYLLAGFELELYANYEYHYVYWYLYEMLYSWLINTLHRADNFLLENETMADSQQKGRSNKKNKKRKRIKTLNKEITLAQAGQQMFGGYYKAVMGFRMDGKMHQPEFQFDNEEVRYSHRFQPFTSVSTPPYIHYAQYKDMSDMKRYEPDATAVNLYGASCKCFHQAKVLLESFQNPSDEVQAMIKVAKVNFVVMKILMGGHKQDSTDPPIFDFTIHPVYPTIKMV